MSGVMGNVLKAIQLKARFLFGLFLLGAIGLFMPDHLALKLGIDKIRDTYRGWIGICTLAAFAFFLVQLFPIFHKAILTRKRRTAILKSLNAISVRERQLLAYCLECGHRTVSLPLIDPRGHALEQKGLMVKGTGVGDMPNWPFTIPAFVWMYMERNKDRLFADMSDGSIEDDNC